MNVLAIEPFSRPGEQRDPESQTQKVARAVYEHIRAHRLKAGDTLPSEGALSESLGVSRGIVREAIRALAACSIVDVGTGRRARVGAVDERVFATLIDHAVRTEQIGVQQIWDLRRAIELRTAALAAMRRTDEEATIIGDHARDMRAAYPDIEAITCHDFGFHRAIARATRNPMYGLIISAFGVVMEATGPIGWYSRPNEERVAVFNLHDAIAAAIRGRNPSAAEKAMADHFDLSVKALVAAGIQ